MQYIKIPIHSEGEGIKIVEMHMGAIRWRRMDDGSLEGYPYSSDDPIIIVAVPTSVSSGCLASGVNLTVGAERKAENL